MKKNKGRIIKKKVVEPRGYYQMTLYDKRDHSRRVILTMISEDPEIYEIKDSNNEINGTVEYDDLPYFYADHDYLSILKCKEDK